MPKYVVCLLTERKQRNTLQSKNGHQNTQRWNLLKWIFSCKFTNMNSQLSSSTSPLIISTQNITLHPSLTFQDVSADSEVSYPTLVPFASDIEGSTPFGGGKKRTVEKSVFINYISLSIRVFLDGFLWKGASCWVYALPFYNPSSSTFLYLGNYW